MYSFYHSVDITEIIGLLNKVSYTTEITDDPDKKQTPLLTY